MWSRGGVAVMDNSGRLSLDVAPNEVHFNNSCLVFGSEVVQKPSEGANQRALKPQDQPAA
jgi:activator of 2-hydroxyglutaryl-CoA dehydratase